MPGAFCDASVARASGTAMPTTEATEKSGAVSTGRASSTRSRCTSRREVAAAATTPAPRASSTAYRASHRLPSRYATRTAPAIQGPVRRAVKTPVPKLKRMPASMAETTAAGTCRISRPNTPVNPTSVITAPATTNAPTASAYAYAPRLVTSSAAPGVDHAVMTGVRVHRLSPMHVSPLPMETAHTHELVCAPSSRPAEAAASTMTSGPEYDTTTATRPARTADRDRSPRSPRRPGGGCGAGLVLSVPAGAGPAPAPVVVLLSKLKACPSRHAPVACPRPVMPFGPAGRRRVSMDEVLIGPPRMCSGVRPDFPHLAGRPPPGTPCSARLPPPGPRPSRPGRRTLSRPGRSPFPSRWPRRLGDRYVTRPPPGHTADPWRS